MSSLRLVCSGLEYQQHYRKRIPVDQISSVDWEDSALDGISDTTEPIAR